MISFPARFGLGDPVWLDPAIAAVGIIIALIAAVVFYKLIFPLILRVTQWTPTDLDTRMLSATRRPLTAAIVLLGVYLSVVIPLDLDAGQRDQADTVAGLLGIVLGVLVVAVLFSNAMDWYLENLADRTHHLVDLRLFPLLRRVSVVIIYGLGALLILDLLDINISPLIAGLGIGGLAVALALQPTLANLFAGTYVMTEGVITPGDYIELEEGVSGYVVEVGWRSTRIRTWRNNLIIVPNNRFAETIITNYQRPTLAVNVWLQCGISYDSDLYHVEQVCREVMDDLLDTNPHAIKEYGGWFGFENFGDSNVNFWLFVQARDRLGSFELQTALMQALHHRFKNEDIVINYPVRTLQFPKEWGPEALLERNGQEAGAAGTGKYREPEEGDGGTETSRRRRRQRRRQRRPRTLHVSQEDSGSEVDTPDVG